MTANPVTLIGGISDTTNVAKSDFIGWAKARVAQVLADVTEVRNTVLASQILVIVKSTGATFKLDTSDTTTADDGVNCIISSDGGLPLENSHRAVRSMLALYEREFVDVPQAGPSQ